jgi:hypothetical protein
MDIDMDMDMDMDINGLDASNSFLNADTAQGFNFLDYKKKYATDPGNNHDLLEKSSSPEWGSIIEAADGTDSLSQYKSAAQKNLAANEIAFNALLSQYTTAYNSYIGSSYMTNVAAGRVPSATDSSGNTVAEKNLQDLNTQLLTLARTIATELTGLSTTDSSLRSSIASKQSKLLTSVAQLQAQQERLTGTNQTNEMDTIDGALETTGLHMNSVYFHYIVYFFIGIVLLVFIFNISVNPNADVKNAGFFLVALLAVYLLSRRAMNN